MAFIIYGDKYREVTKQDIINDIVTILTDKKFEDVRANRRLAKLSFKDLIWLRDMIISCKNETRL